MAASFEKSLISLEDIKRFRPVADLDFSRIEPYIKETQIVELKNVLGDAFHYDFFLRVENSADSKYADYQKLLRGAVWKYNGYDQEFLGIVPMLVYYSLKRFFPNNPVHITRYGNTFKKDEFSEPIDKTTMQQVLSEMQSVGYAHESEVRKYLSQNESLYPLYQQNNISSVTGGGFKLLDLD